jgi:hypothetical protein
VLSTTPLPWYVGTAAYPDGAEIADIPLDVIVGQGRIFWVADPGVPLPVVPPGHRAGEVRCAIEACLTIYSPPGG